MESEGHGFLNPENNIEMFPAIERFLARTIGDNGRHDCRGLPAEPH
jgi:hypothetical protein